MFKLNRDGEGNIIRHKARGVPQGFAQRHGIHRNKVFAPVVRYSSICALLAITKVHQMDVKTAFFNGSVTGEIYMYMKQSFFEDLEKPNAVCNAHESHATDKTVVEQL